MSDGSSRQRAKILTIRPSVLHRFRLVNELKRAIFAAIYNHELKDGDYFAFNIRQDKVFQLEKEYYNDSSGFTKETWAIYDAMTGEGEYLSHPGARLEDIALAPVSTAMSMYEAAGNWLSRMGDRVEEEKRRFQQQRDAIKNWDRNFVD